MALWPPCKRCEAFPCHVLSVLSQNPFMHAMGAWVHYGVSGLWACMAEQGACTKSYLSNA